MGGKSYGPTNWWELPEYNGNTGNPNTSTPPSGYYYDPIAMGYRPIAGSPSDVLAQRQREQSIQDADRSRRQTYEDQQRSSSEAMRQRLIQMLNDESSGSSRGGSSGGGGSYSSGGGGSVPFTYSGSSAVPSSVMADVPEIERVVLPDNSAAAAAAFARAKDKIGAETAGSVSALRSALAGRGMLGGGSERRGTTSILTAGQANLGDTTREQAVSDVNRMTDFARMGYEGAIAQRGQDVTQRGQTIGAYDSAANRDLSAASTAYSGRISMRGQDLSASEGAANRQLQSDLAARASRRSSVNALLSRLY